MRIWWPKLKMCIGLSTPFRHLLFQHRRLRRTQTYSMKNKWTAVMILSLEMKVVPETSLLTLTKRSSSRKRQQWWPENHKYLMKYGTIRMILSGNLASILCVNRHIQLLKRTKMATKKNTSKRQKNSNGDLCNSDVQLI